MINCCINHRGKCSFFGRICITTASFTPDLSHLVLHISGFSTCQALHSLTDVQGENRADYALRNIPTHAFEANALYLEIIRLAYNLVTAFQQACLPQEWQTLTLSKLRHRLFWLPGQLTRPQHRPTLRLANSPLIATRGEKILHRVQRLKPLEG